MAFSVQMPALGESVTEGTVTRWLKQEGDTVELDEPLVEVSTDKIDTEIPSPAAGVLTKIIAQEDDTIEVGGDLALIGDPSVAGASQAPARAPSRPQPEAKAPPQLEPEPEPAAAAPREPEPAAPAQQDSGGGTATPVLMPELGESVTEGTVTRWLKQVGDSVEVDEPLVEVSTDKVDTEIPSPVAGVLVTITADQDATVPVGGELARIGVGADATAASASKPPPAPEPEPKPEPAPQPKAEPKPEAQPVSRAEVAAKPAPAPHPQPAQAQPAAGADGVGAPYLTPLVRKLATEHNIDLAEVNGTGVGGRIRKHDVLAAAEQKAQQKEEAKKAPAPAQAPAAAPAVDSGKPAPGAARTPAPALAHLRGTTQKASRIRQITATKTRESLQATAQLTQTHEVDMTRIVGLRARAKAGFAEREGVNLTFLPFFARAVIDALKIHPNINASYNEETKAITYYDAEHLGFAVDTEQGLLSPVVHNAGDLSLGGLARAIADIAARARSGNLKPDELSGGTFTITNIGSQGALFDTPILVPPQAAMLGTGAIVKRPRVVVDDSGNESIGVRSVCYLPLTYDHRLIDGADAGRFLTTIKHRLEEGAFEADLGL
jgi:pyruvate dehydrogenase E2 component (dihydrolipoamide acetyltransferase)